MPAFDPFTATISNIQEAYSNGSLNTMSVVETYYSQIEAQNDYLHAIIALPPKSQLLEQAQALDEERKISGARSPLHGIPVIVKDNIATHPDLGVPETTAGSYALVGSRVRKSAPVVEKLVKAGAIILGKANLSEFSALKGPAVVGWSALGGQTQSPYVKGGMNKDKPDGDSNPGGSSSGSAVSVAAGLTTVAIGTETNGSIVIPGSRNALYCLKPTIGIVSQEGVIPISNLCDSVGPMARCSRDVAYMLDVMVDTSKTSFPSGGYSTFLDGKWDGIRVGAVALYDWMCKLDVEEDTRQMFCDTNAAYGKLEGLLGPSFHRNIALISVEEVDQDEDGVDHLERVMMNDIQSLLNKYLQDLETSPVRSLSELIDFNIKNADKELPKENPDQGRLLYARDVTPLTPEAYNKSLTYFRQKSQKEGIDKTLLQYGVDVIIGPSESDLHTIASAAGYPIATVPLSRLKQSGRPFGLFVMTTAKGEGNILKFMSAWEGSFRKRDVPTCRGNV